MVGHLDRAGRTARRPHGAPAGVSPCYRVHDQRGRDERNPVRHRPWGVRGVHQRRACRRHRARSRLHGLPLPSAGTRLRCGPPRRRRRQRHGRAAERRVVARPARGDPRDRRLRQHHCLPRRTAPRTRLGRAHDRGHRRFLAIDPQPCAGCRPHRRRGARSVPPCAGLGERRHRPQRLGPGGRGLPRIHRAVRADRATDPPRAGVVGGVGHRDSARAARRRLRAEQQRLDPARHPRSGGHGAHHRPRRSTRCRRRRHPRQHRARRIRRAAGCAVPDRHGGVGRRRLGVRTTPQHEGLSLRPHRRPPRQPSPGDGDEHRGAQRLHHPRLVRVFRRARQPAPRRRRVELSRQCVRAAHRLPHA